MVFPVVIYGCENESYSVVFNCLQSCGGPPASSVHGILQARILEWVAIPFSWESSQFKDGTQVSCIAGGFFFGFFVFNHISHQENPIEINLQNRKRLTTNLRLLGRKGLLGSLGWNCTHCYVQNRWPTRIYGIALGILLSVVCWPGWEWSLGGVWISVYLWLGPFTVYMKLS